MSYFTEDFNQFFAGLALNNEKSWMDDHRKDYQNQVKKPWDAFLAELLNAIREFDDIDDLPVGKFQFRINRDIRFSNDKTPYNPWVSAAMMKEGKKYLGPGYYIRLGVEGLTLGGGMYNPDKQQLMSIRRAIMNDPNGLEKIVNAKAHKQKWGTEIRGEKNKVIPKEFKQAAETTPLLFNKGFTFWKDGSVDDIVRDDLLEYAVGHFKAGAAFNAYLKQALERG